MIAFLELSKEKQAIAKKYNLCSTRLLPEISVTEFLTAHLSLGF